MILQISAAWDTVVAQRRLVVVWRATPLCVRVQKTISAMVWCVSPPLLARRPSVVMLMPHAILSLYLAVSVTLGSLAVASPVSHCPTVLVFATTVLSLV